MRTSDGKPRDRVPSYKDGTSWATSKPSQGSTTHINDASLKKKHYRARGCRGGASRKGRKKQINHHVEREGQENLDPLPSTSLPPSGFIAKDINDDEPKEEFSASQSHNINSYKSQKKVTFSSHTEKHLYAAEPKEKRKFMHSFAGFGHKAVPPQQVKTSMAILPSESDAEGNIELLLDENANPNSAVASPANRAIIKGSSPARSPGFSFFSISPRSYLTGRKSKAQKVNH